MGKLEVSVIKELELSLVMPAYNEAEKIQKVVERVDHAISKTGFRYEVIVVDDGSADDTHRKIMTYAKKNGHIKVISYTKNMGKGYAIKKGFAHAKGDIIVFMDSDSDIHPEQISRYVEVLNNNKGLEYVEDIVIASKRLPQSKVEMPLIRRIFSYAFNMLAKFLTGIRVSDTQTGLKVVRRKAFKKVFSRLSVNRFAFDVELLVVAKLYGLRFVELPVSLNVKYGLFSLREVWRMFIDLLEIACRLKILRSY